MKISISAELTNEDLELLATRKGRQKEVVANRSRVKNEDTGNPEEEIEYGPNPITAAEFVTKSYQDMIINDATQIFIYAKTEAIEAQRQAVAEAVRTSVINSITSITK